jgi:predicted transcriptional regulator
VERLLTAAEIAELLGVSADTVLDWFDAARSPACAELPTEVQGEDEPFVVATREVASSLAAGRKSD